jgi:hypothetical protein
MFMIALGLGRPDIVDQRRRVLLDAAYLEQPSRKA